MRCAARATSKCRCGPQTTGAALRSRTTVPAFLRGFARRSSRRSSRPSREARASDCRQPSVSLKPTVGRSTSAARRAAGRPSLSNYQPIDSGRLGSCKGGPAMSTAARCLRVLVVDDEPLIRWSIAETLGAAGHQVTEAQDAASALRALADAPDTDLVLLDFRLPDSNDLGLLAEIRRMAPAVPVIMMTAFGTPDVTAGALKLGASRV